MSGISTHVLDTSVGKPVVGMKIALSLREAGGFRELGRALTDGDGRARGLLGELPLLAGVYRLSFEVAAYFRAATRPAFFERVELEFEVADPAQHYHVPLLLSPFGYSTYRGS
jgi:5-hydroxyisourate hydrolase